MTTAKMTVAQFKKEMLSQNSVKVYKVKRIQKDWGGGISSDYTVITWAKQYNSTTVSTQSTCEYDTHDLGEILNRW